MQKQSLTTLGDTRKEALANAQLVRTTAQADAALTWKQADSGARKTYSIGAAAADLVFATAQANAEWTEAGSLATAESTRDNLLALADRTFWNAQTAASNTRRTAAATADVALWSAQYSDQITAVQSIDTVLDSPWSQYLVDEAIARRDWWLTEDDDYVARSVSHNANETAYQTAISDAYAQQMSGNSGIGLVGVIPADFNHAAAVAGAAQARSMALAQAASTYVNTVAGPAEAYLNAVAQAERTYAVAVAEADRNHAVNPNAAARTAAIQQADTARKTALRTAKQTFGQAEGQAGAAQLTANANAVYSARIAEINSTVAHDHAETAARLYYVQAAGDAMVIVTQTRAAYGELQATELADGWRIAAQAFSVSNASPWASYNAAEATANDEQFVTAAASAQETFENAVAVADRAQSIALTAADKSRRDAYSTATAAYDTAKASANLALGTAQATVLAAWSGSGSYSPPLPVVAAAPKLPSYAVPAAWDGRYYVNVSFAGYNGWGCGGFFGSGFGCWGGFGGWWGGGYFGGGFFGGWNPFGSIYAYGFGEWDPITGYLGGGTSSNLLGGAGLSDYNFGFGGYFSNPSLPEPQPPLPLEAGYWDLAKEVKSITDPPQSDGRYQVTQLALLTARADSVSLPQGAGASQPSSGQSNTLGTASFTAQANQSGAGSNPAGINDVYEGRNWSHDGVKNLLRALSVISEDTKPLTQFYEQKVQLKMTPFKPAHWVWFWYPWAKGASRRAFTEAPRQTLPEHLQGAAGSKGMIDDVFVHVPAEWSNRKVVEYILTQIETANTPLNNAALEFLGSGQYKGDGRSSYEDLGEQYQRRSQSRTKQIMAEAAGEAKEYILTVVGALGPGGGLVVMAYQASEGNIKGAVWEGIFLLPLTDVLGEGLKGIRLVAKNDEAVELPIKALEGIQHLSPEQRKAIAERIELAVKNADNAEGVIKALEKEGLFKLPSLSEIPTLAKGFDEWFDALSPAELSRYYGDQDLKEHIGDLLRGEGKNHEFLTCGTADHWKQWGITANQLREEFTIPIATLNEGGVAKGWKHSGGIKGMKYPGSKTVHIQLDAIIRSSNSLEDLRVKIVPWAETWLNGGVKALPKALQ